MAGAHPISSASSAYSVSSPTFNAGRVTESNTKSVYLYIALTIITSLGVGLGLYYGLHISPLYSALASTATTIVMGLAFYLYYKNRSPQPLEQQQPVHHPMPPASALTHSPASVALTPAAVPQVATRPATALEIPNENQRILNAFSKEYRFLPDEKRKELRKQIYDKLAPLFQGGFLLPFVGYEGETLSVHVSFDINGAPFLEFKAQIENSNETWRISIDSQGATRFAYNVSDKTMVIYDEQAAGQQDAHLSKALAHMQLIYVKLGQIVSYIHNAPNFEINVFRKTLQLLRSFCGPATHSAATSSPSTALVSAGSSSTQTTTIGKFWNPVVASQDSFFTWEITHHENGKVILELKKVAEGRDFHSEQIRAVTLSLDTPDSNTMTLKISKAMTSGWGDSDNVSTYILSENQGKLSIIPEGTHQASIDYLPFYGSDSITSQTSGAQTLQQIHQDMRYIFSVLTTIYELQNSPYTLLFDEANFACFSLSGAPIEPEVIKKMLSVHQGNIHNSNTPSYKLKAATDSDLQARIAQHNAAQGITASSPPGFRMLFQAMNLLTK